MVFSFSHVQLYKQCPRAFFLRYVRGGVDPPEIDPFDPRRLGTMFHDALETSEHQAAEKWLDELGVTSTLAEDELVKLFYLTPLARQYIPVGSDFEVELADDQFHGFIDVLYGGVLIDIKRSNRIDHYLNSGQVGVYARELERIKGIRPKELYYLFIPAVSPRRYRKCKSRDKDEEDWEFRNRLKGLLEQSEVKLIPASFDCGDYYEKVTEIKQKLADGSVFEKNTSSCSRCDWKEICCAVTEK